MHFGRMADGLLCVTRAMQHELSQNWGIKATVLYDQPPEFFRPASLEEQHKLFFKLDKNLRQPLGAEDCISPGTAEAVNKDMLETIFTTLVNADITLKPNRPALIVSSTSWTPDEDFGLLLEAAVMYDRHVAAILNEVDSNKEEVLWKEMQGGKQYLYPRLLFVITGKGPGKEKYEEKIRRLNPKRVAFPTAWLSAEDYPLLLGSADVGVCAHVLIRVGSSHEGRGHVWLWTAGLCRFLLMHQRTSASGEKWPLSSSSELADELLMLFKGFPDACDSLKVLRNDALEVSSSVRWATEWEEHAKG